MKILGQDHIVTYLTNGLASDRLSPSLFFSGPEGVGKKSAALELAKTWACQVNEPEGLSGCQTCDSCVKIQKTAHPDLFFADFPLQAEILREKPEKQNSIKLDTIREAIKFLNYRPMESRRRILIVEQADLMTIEAANALLKILEEPPAQSQIVLLGKNPRNLPSTILSRCANLIFRSVPTPLLAEWVHKNHGVEKDRSEEIADLARGSFSRAESLMEETPVDTELDDFELDEFFASVADGAFRREGKKNAVSLINHLIEKAQRRLEEGDLSGAEDLKSLLSARHQVDRFVPPRLVMENLFLKIKKRRKTLAS